MKWTFAKNEGGRDSGLNHAGIEMFKGNTDRSLAREIGQNSCDARRDKNRPVLLKFELMELERSKIPDIDGLAATFSRCAEDWQHQNKTLKFFKNAEELARAEKITVLRIGDYNTRGLLGSDADRSNDWYNLIRCSGSSSKGAGEGGSYGIGKNAPFAASEMRTVLYSTYNTDNEYAFVGVSTLVSHTHPEGGSAQPDGFLGGEKGASVRDKRQIPSVFLRKEYGTDIVILGFNAADKWQRDLIYSVLDNFWPAIHFETLEVQIGDIKITKATLNELMQLYSLEEDFTAHLYYQAFVNFTHDFHKDLPILGDVDLYMMASDADLPKRVAMVRKTGMVIYLRQFRSIIPFCGVFTCRNDKGNNVLRDMEPPTHDKWDSDHPEKGANKKADKEIGDYIRHCIGELSPADDSTVLNVPGLSKFLPDDDETPEDSFDGAGEVSQQETPERRQLPEIIPSEKIDLKKRYAEPADFSPANADDEVQSGVEEGTGGSTEGTSEGGGGDGNGGGSNEGDGSGFMNGADGAVQGAQGGSTPKTSIPVRYRTYCRNAASGVYVAVVSPEKTKVKEAELTIWAVGDDQKVPVQLQTARTFSGEVIPISRGCILGPVKFVKDQPLKLEIVLKRPQRFAMEVSAHEA